MDLNQSRAYGIVLASFSGFSFLLRQAMKSWKNRAHFIDRKLVNQGYLPHDILLNTNLYIILYFIFLIIFLIRRILVIREFHSIKL